MQHWEPLLIVLVFLILDHGTILYLSFKSELFLKIKYLKKLKKAPYSLLDFELNIYAKILNKQKLKKIKNKKLTRKFLKDFFTKQKLITHLITRLDLIKEKNISNDLTRKLKLKSKIEKLDVFIKERHSRFIKI